jgi:hypothetical protein
MSKYMKTHYHAAREGVEAATFQLIWVRSNTQLADTFTKALPEPATIAQCRQIAIGLSTD